MLENSDTTISTVLEIFSKRGIEISFLVPTQTAMKTSIIDAIIPLRRYLKDNNFHDYNLQLQGSEHKKINQAFFVGTNSLSETRVSLYRPKTKKGDPRIWLYRLSSYAAANNLLVTICHDGKLYIVNASRNDLLKTIEISGSPLSDLVENIITQHSPASLELLDRLRKLSAKGFVKSKYPGNTGVGAMLLHEIGVPVYDMSKGPDFRGIEIKAQRMKRQKGTLFGQVPNWEISNLKSSLEILNKYGYWSTKRQREQLYVTLSASSPNPQGLYLEVDYEEDWLKSLSSGDTPSPSCIKRTMSHTLNGSSRTA